jgi:hypothetical protein
LNRSYSHLHPLLLALAKHDIEVVLIKDGSPLSHRLDSETGYWVRVFTGEHEVVFARADVAAR